MSNKKKRTLKVEGQHTYVRSAEPPTAMEDLRSFCPETVDAFLNEAECLLDAALARKKLGNWESSFNYQKLAHERLIRLLKVADLQAAYAGKELVEEGEESAELAKEGDAAGGDASKGDEAKEPAKVVGPSGSKTRWTDAELDKLYIAAREVGDSLNKENMMKVSQAVGTKTAAQCRTKITQLAQSERITHEWLAQRVKLFNEEYAKRQQQAQSDSGSDSGSESDSDSNSDSD